MKMSEERRKISKCPIQQAKLLVRHGEGTLHCDEGVRRSKGTLRRNEPKELKMLATGSSW